MRTTPTLTDTTALFDQEGGGESGICILVPLVPMWLHVATLCIYAANKGP